MMTFDKSLDHLYGDLCIRQRQLTRSLENGETLCCHCNRSESSHLPDKRCSVNALSGTFRPIDQSERDNVREALELIEKLRPILDAIP